MACWCIESCDEVIDILSCVLYIHAYAQSHTHITVLTNMRQQRTFNDAVAKAKSLKTSNEVIFTIRVKIAKCQMAMKDYMAVQETVCTYVCICSPIYSMYVADLQHTPEESRARRECIAGFGKY